MKIYVVTSGEYSDYGICAVFTDKEKAKLFCALREDWFEPPRIEEYDTSDDIPAEAKRVVKLCRVCIGIFSSSGTVTTFYGFERENSVEEDWATYTVVFETKNDISDDVAIKIARDMVAEYKAKKEGIC